MSLVAWKECPASMSEIRISQQLRRLGIDFAPRLVAGWRVINHVHVAVFIGITDLYDGKFLVILADPGAQADDVRNIPILYAPLEVFGAISSSTPFDLLCSVATSSFHLAAVQHSTNVIAGICGCPGPGTLNE